MPGLSGFPERESKTMPECESQARQTNARIKDEIYYVGIYYGRCTVTPIAVYL